MKNKNKFMLKLKDAMEGEEPVDVSVEGILCKLHVLSLDDMSALGEVGGVVSFIVRDIDIDGYPKNSQQKNPTY